MLNRLYQAATVILLGVVVGWVGYIEGTRATQLAEIQSVARQQTCARQEIAATQQAQAYAQPIVALAQGLGRENMRLMAVVDQAKAIVKTQSTELTQTREALNNSMELMQDQIEENNRCVDHIRSLEDYIRMLMAKIPDEDCPPPPRMQEEEELL